MFDWLKRVIGGSTRHRKRRRHSEEQFTRRNPPARLPPRRPEQVSPKWQVATNQLATMTVNSVQVIAEPGKETKQLTPPLLGDNYELHGVVGYGGFGVVYLVYSLASNSIHVLKTYHDRYVGNRRIEQAFRKEAQVWIELERHANLVEATFVERIGDRLFLAMEFIAPDEEGRNNLEHYLGAAELNLRQGLHWAIQVCLGMEHAYGRGIRCHRDLKPSNIMITRDLQARVSDFGLATICSAEGPAAEATGTPSHMSPEQFKGADSCDQRSDIYSFGVVLFQMFRDGKLPFEAESPKNHEGVGKYWDAFRRMHMTATPPAFISPAAAIVGRCLEKSPMDRYQSFADLRQDLEATLRDEFGESYCSPSPVVLDACDQINKGMSLHNLGRFEEALLCYQKQSKRIPNWPQRGATGEEH